MSIEALDKGLDKLLSVPKSVADGDLVIGDTIIPCAVLENEIRVVTQRGVENALGRSKPRKKSLADELPSFLRPKALKSFINKELLLPTLSPIKFMHPTGVIAHGLKAELLPKVCDIWVQADRAGVLKKNQKHIAERAYLLLNGFATIGIVALVDEATGYQDIRNKKALADILEKYLEKTGYHQWSKTFPLEFYSEIFRLKGWDFNKLPDGKKPPTPQVIGKYTNAIIYGRLAPGILDELKIRNPKNSMGNLAVRHHQWFNHDMGHPKLKQHLAGVIVAMRLSKDWEDFKRKIKTAYPMAGDQNEADLDD